MIPDRDTWTRLNPDLSIEKKSCCADRAAGSIPERVKLEGWTQTEPILEVERLRAGVEALVRERWLPVFGFVYDEFWLASRGPSVRALLGPGYKQKPHVWVQRVEPEMSACGWPPHVERDDGERDLSVWIALTDATLENGCLYLLPRYAGMLPDPVPRGEWVGLLQSVRAVPAQAGSLLCWRQNVLHWGSYSSLRACGPRVSVALEFQADDGEGLIDPRGPPLPTFEARLQLIARQMLKYLGEFEPRRWERRWIDLAEEIVKSC